MSSLFSQNATAGMQCVAVTTREIPNGQVVELVFSASSPHQNSPLNNPALMATPNDLDQPVDDINDIANLRRHHTISTARRPPRAHPRIPISEVENEDEFVGADWVAGAGGVVGEGKGLHRAGSLPSRYNNTRGYRQMGTSSGTMTPARTLVKNSLSAITAEHGLEAEEADEEGLWGQIRDWRGDDLAVPSIEALSLGGQIVQGDHHRSLSQSSHSSSISPMMSENATMPPLPPNAGAGVRRHQSLTYGAHGHPPPGTGGARSLMRAATIGKTSRAATLSSHNDAPADDLQTGYYDDMDDEGIVSPSSNSTGHGSNGHGTRWGGAGSTSGTPNSTSPWGPPAQPAARPEDAIDELQRGLGGLELDNTASTANAQNPYGSYAGMYNSGQATLSQPPQNPNHTRKLTPPPSYPPRFRSPSPGNGVEAGSYASAVANAALKSPNILQAGNPVSQVTSPSGRSPIHKLSLVTNLPQNSKQKNLGPVSAAAYVPPPGGGLPLGEDLGNGQKVDADPTPTATGGRDKPLTATGTAWDQKERLIGGRGSGDAQAAGGGFNPAQFFTNPAMFASFDPALQQQIMQHIQQQQAMTSVSPQPQANLPFGAGYGAANMQGMAGLQGLQMLQAQMLQQQLLQQTLYQPAPHGQYAQPSHHGVPSRSGPSASGGPVGLGINNTPFSTAQPAVTADVAETLLNPVDIQALCTSKGYNPTTFDIKPPYARFFVIKSYTEDDVHKSLKYEIWSSTEPGNKRLDKAFKETNGRGPIYLFFSVNASGHFCGVAEMLTPVDYTRSSTVWAQDKWKGVIKVKWIFVRDIPNAALRHIRLTNTQEQKPVTNSRDTQELLPEAGHEMLRIFLNHPSRTSLLQDFAFYELQALQRTIQTPEQPQADQQRSPNPQSPPEQSTSPKPTNGPLGFVSPTQLNNAQRQTPPLRQPPVHVFGSPAAPYANRI